MKRAYRKVIASLMAMVMLASVCAVTALAANQNNVRHYGTYVCIGDSVASGFGLPDYNKYGRKIVYKQRIKGSYADHVARDTHAKFYSLDTFGMVGGHCEFDIVLERANSIKVLGRLLNNILHAAPGVKVATVSGGVQNNVIPSESNAVLAVADEDLETVKKVVADTYAELKDEYSIADKGLTVEFKEAEKCDKVFTSKTAQIITQSILLTPNAVMSMSMKIPGISECSNNIGLMTTDENEITIISTITASVTTRKHEVMKTIFALADAIGNGVKAEQFGCDAPEWIYNPDSPMLAVAKKAYEEEVGEPAKIEVMPASLELGLFQNRIPGLDIIAVGTVTHGVHSPSEECEVASVGKVWKIFKNMLAQMKD